MVNIEVLFAFTVFTYLPLAFTTAVLVERKSENWPSHLHWPSDVLMFRKKLVPRCFAEDVHQFILAF